MSAVSHPEMAPLAASDNPGRTGAAGNLRRITRIARYVVVDVLRNRWVIGYALFIALATDVLLRLGGTGPRTLVSLLNLVLLVVPLVTIVFVTIYWHGQREFNELLLSQPVDRPTLFHGLFGGVMLPLMIAWVAGVALPLLGHRAIGPDSRTTFVLLLVVGVLLTAIFGALAMLVAGLVEDRLKGLGLALGIWLVMAIGWDALLLWIAMAFSDHPIEWVLLTLTFANPIDLARVLMVLQFDVAALMGATGAVFAQVLGGPRGIVIALGALSLWAVLPGYVALRAFRHRDF